MMPVVQPLSGAEVFRQGAQNAARPDPNLKVSEWSSMMSEIARTSGLRPVLTIGDYTPSRLAGQSN